MSNTVKLNTCPKCGAAIPAGAPQGLCPKCVMAGAATATESGLAPTATGEIPSLERVATAFPQLEILELIGRGGMGFVFKARQPSLDRLVALKLLPDKLAKDANFTERFNREGRVLGRLNHANIVSIYDFGQTGGFYYLLMEYVDGVNLRQAMRAGRFSPAEALAIVPKVCEALQYAHEQGVLHRDIKPENILLDAKGRVKIADFGIAKLVDDSPLEVTLTGTGAALGTPHYMAPEQLEKPSTVDHRADIYSLGVVFYEMLTGELPIGRFAAPSSKTPVGANVDEVVFRTLEKEPSDRYQSAGEVRTCVQVLADEASAADRRGPASPPVGAPMGPHGTVVLGDAASANQPAQGSFSRWSIYGAMLVGLSLPAPMRILVLMLTPGGGVGATDLWIALGSVAMPGLGGTLLGWLGLNEIRENRGRVRGLPLAMFATLMWPLTIVGGLTVGVPMFVLAPVGDPTTTHTIGRILILLLPAGVITFAFWSIHATARWAGQPAPTQQRGLLKWVFISILVIGMGMVMVLMPNRRSHDRTPPALHLEIAETTSRPVELEPMIQFTFTTAELREEAGAHWLVMTYLQQVRGDCERVFFYAAEIPGFTPQTRMESFMTDAKGGFTPVLHQRVLWKLPDNVSPADSLELRDRVTKEWVGKAVTIKPGDKRTIFELQVQDGGALTVSIGVKWNSENNSSGQTRQAAVSPAKTAASIELWAPEPAPGGEKPKPFEILQEAAALTKQGHYEEALQRHLWYHHHALEFQPSQAGVRLSFALAQWIDLSRRYPKAKTALIEIRDRKVDEFSGNGGTFKQFTEASYINKALGEDHATVGLFQSLQTQNPKLARQCYPLVEDLLMERGEYALCASFIPDARERFHQIRTKWEKTLKVAERTPAASAGGLLQKETQRVFIKETRALIEILVGVDHKADAEEIRDEALSVLDTPELHSAVADAETRVWQTTAVK